MSKVLGIDMGTNSIGWAIIERNENSVKLVDNGVHIFQEGVNRVKGNEEPAVKTRTEARASRRHYFRKRLRKIELLKILVEKQWCPYLSPATLKSWKETKLFPLDPDFLAWLRTDELSRVNPYYDRHRCLTEILDLNRKEDRYCLGRAFYHLNQRRGFLSNRKDQSSSGDDGVVKKGIGELDEAMAEAGFDIIGEYFFHLYESGEKIRNHYTDRKAHYVKEFQTICQKQGLDAELVQRLYDAIFFQRPLKSQKGLVGKCPFEKGKTRCPVSHPDFEEFRMLSFINNIRIALPGDVEMRRLSEDEQELITPLFYRKSKENFDFSDISKKVAGRKTQVMFDNGKGEVMQNSLRLNFRETTNVSGCPVTAQLKSIFGDDWEDGISERYLLSEGKSQAEIINDVWHALYFFDSDEKLQQWAEDRLQLSEKEAVEFSRIKMPQGYASLSHCAIGKILPWLRLGYRYDEAVMLANLPSVVPKRVWSIDGKKSEIEEAIINIVTTYSPNPDIKNDSKERKIEEELCNLGIFDINIDRLYHPSLIEVYPKSKPNADGRLLLQSPRVDSVRNPMAMRALFRLRALVNELLKEEKIDKNTKVNIELSRSLNDFNTRRAIEILQRENEKKRIGYRSEINSYYASQGINTDASEEDILKYELWEEQNHICLYTGMQIPLSGFLGSNPRFDIEHTVPRSRGGDNSKANKTLCECRFNRDVKRGHLPSELSTNQEILARIESTGWEEEIERLRKEIGRSTRNAKAAADKDSKDRAIQRRHISQMKMTYYLDKIGRFKMKEVPEGFSNRQGADIGVIGRYARMYMQSVFDKVYTVKGETTAEFRKLWGLQDNYCKKERVNHSHHCIDAITIACIGKNEYDRWAQYKADDEQYYFNNGDKPSFPKPWNTFTEDVKAISDSLLVSHYTADNMPKDTKKKLRKNGVIQRGTDGVPLYVQGNSARGSLHLQTFYGSIMVDNNVQYVVRKNISSLSEKDINNIVDNEVREKVRRAVEIRGIQALQGTIWMNEAKQIPIKKVRIFVPTITNPVSLKQHRFISPADYKRNYYVSNESNYAIAIYERLDSKGKSKRSFKIINNLDAARLLNKKSQLFDAIDENGYHLLYVLKSGTMVIFYENDKKEVLGASKTELSSRLYKTSGISISRVQQYEYGLMTFIHHQEARMSGDIQYRKGIWKHDDQYRAKVEINHNQIHAMVEGYDFSISTSGEIEFIEK